MNSKKFKIGDKVKIINASSVEFCELNKVGTVVNMEDYDTGSLTYVVDMGRPRRETEPKETCWWLNEKYIELVSKPNEQLLFVFMNEVT